MLACIVKNNVVVNVIEVPNEEVMNSLNIGAVNLGPFPVIGDTVVNGVIPEMEAREAGEHIRTLRLERNRLLKESDWTQLADAPVDKAAWATYRQELRDLPTQENFPDNIVYPTIPE